MAVKGRRVKLQRQQRRPRRGKPQSEALRRSLAGRSVRDLRPSVGRPGPGSPGGGQATPPGPALPYSASLETGLSNNQRAAELAQAQYDEDKQRLYGRFFDPRNAFSQLAELRHAQQIRQRASLNQSAAQGQQYSGSFANQEGERLRSDAGELQGLNESYQDQLAQSGRALQSTLFGLTASSQQLRGDYADAVMGDVKATPVPPTPRRWQVNTTKNKRAGKRFYVERIGGRKYHVYENGRRVPVRG